MLETILYLIIFPPVKSDDLSKKYYTYQLQADEIIKIIFIICVRFDDSQTGERGV